MVIVCDVNRVREGSGGEAYLNEWDELRSRNCKAIRNVVEIDNEYYCCHRC